MRKILDQWFTLVQQIVLHGGPRQIFTEKLGFYFANHNEHIY